jgi:hypothetical protein
MHPQRVLGQFDSQGHIVGHLAILWEFACQRDMIAPAVGERQGGRLPYAFQKAHE